MLVLTDSYQWFSIMQISINLNITLFLASITICQKRTQRYLKFRKGFFSLKEISINLFNYRKHNNVILKPLKKSDAETINEIWPHRGPNSLEFVVRLITTDLTVGAYDKDSGELMAWCLRIPIGSLGLLQVKPKYYRRGLGKMVAIAQIKQMAELGYDSSGTILFHNKASRTLFKNLGFREWGLRIWMFKEGLGEGHYDLIQ